MVAKKGEMLTKESVIEKVSSQTGASKADTKKMLEAFIDVTTETVSKGGEVNVTGFGKFHQVAKKERNGVNPKTGAKIVISARNSPAFKAGTQFKDAM